MPVQEQSICPRCCASTIAVLCFAPCPSEPPVPRGRRRSLPRGFLGLYYPNEPNRHQNLPAKPGSSQACRQAYNIKTQDLRHGRSSGSEALGAATPVPNKKTHQARTAAAAYSEAVIADLGSTSHVPKWSAVLADKRGPLDHHSRRDKWRLGLGIH